MITGKLHSHMQLYTFNHVHNYANVWIDTIVARMTHAHE